MRRISIEQFIQNMVYTVDHGLVYRILRTCLFCAFLLFVFVWYAITQFTGLKEADAFDQAQVARHIAEGKGFLTGNVRPASMWYLAKGGRFVANKRAILRHPDVVHPPLYPLVLGLGLKLVRPSFQIPSGVGRFAPEWWVVMPVGLGFSLLAALFLFLLGCRLFNRRVALISVLLYVLSDTVLADSVSGLSLSMAACLMTASAYFAVAAVMNGNEGKRFWRWFVPLLLLIGLLVASFLTRYGAVSFVGALLCFVGLGFRKRGWRWAALVSVGFLVGISPWLVRNKVVSGGFFGLTPYLALNDTQMFQETAFERTLRVGKLPEPLVTAGLSRKFMGNATELLETNLASFGGGIFTAFFLISFFFFPAQGRVQRLFHWLFGVSFLLTVLVACVYGGGMLRLLHAFLPFVFLHGAACFLTMVDRLKSRAGLYRIALIVLAVVLSATPAILHVLPPRAALPYPPYWAPIIGQVCGFLDADEILSTDIAPAAAWYGGRACVQMPASVADFYAINDNVAKISGLYFTTVTRARPYSAEVLKGPHASWAPLIEGNEVPKGFPLPLGLAIAGEDQRFFSDYARWAK